MGTLAQFAIAAAAFAVVAGLALWAPRTLSSASLLVVAIAAGAAIAGGLLADAAPTGLEGYDAVLRVLAGLAFVAAGCSATARPLLLASGILVASSLLGSGAAWPAALAFGCSFGLVVLGAEGAAVGAVIGLALGQAALRLDWPETIGTTFVLGAVSLVLVAGSAVVHAHGRTRRRLAIAAVAVASVLVVIGGAWALVASSVRDDLNRAVDTANAGLDAARAGDTEAAAAQFDEARVLFERAANRLEAWWAEPIRLVPVVAQNANALRAMTGAGRELSAAGANMARRASPDEIRPREGKVPLDQVRALDAPLSEAEGALAAARSRLERVGSPWLVTMLASKLEVLDEKIARGARDAETARDAVRVVPRLLGSEGERRYFVAFQTPAELRANGGIIGNFVEVSYADGDVALVRAGRDSDYNQGNPRVPRTLTGPDDYLRRYAAYNPHYLIQNVTLSPDFPSVAEVIEGVYPQTGGSALDGVISLDPVALGEFLRLTGPVVVPGFNVELTPDNAAKVLLREQYVWYPDNTVRVEFLDATVRAVFDRLETTELPGPSRIGEVLGPMVREGRLQLHSIHPDEQRFFRRIGADRAFPATRGGDFFGLVTQNAGGNKIDVFQRRTVRYDALVDPATGAVDATATVTVRNRAASSGLPEYVIGSLADNPLPLGTSRVLLSVYSPLALGSASIDGRPVELLEDEELGRNVFTAQLDIPPGGQSEVVFRLQGAVDLAARGRYRLRVWHQATVKPDRIRIGVQAASGWSVEPVKGLRSMPAGAGRRLVLAEDVTVVAGFAAE